MRSTPAIHFITLGCPKNEVDSDRMITAVSGAAFSVVSTPDDADVVVLNTCGFIQDAVEESIAYAFELSEEWKSADDQRLLIVAGCMPSRYGANDLASAMPEVDAFIPVAEEGLLVETIERLTGTKALSAEHETVLRTARGPSAYLQVSDGCFRSCAYCTIPSIRGPYRSTPLMDLVKEAGVLARGGAREIVLIGQDISAYGRDLDDGNTLADVIRAVARIPEVAWIRLMYVQPDGITSELLEAMATESKVCAYLDMPLQHASAPVLRRMHRGGDAESFLALISRIREALPTVVLRTTFIAGFPGETRADVRILHDFVERAGFDYVGVFPYSPEEGTVAAELDGLPTKRTRLARAQRLRDLADSLAMPRVHRHVDTTLEVLVEGVDEEGTPVGRWRGQAPEIDGIVLLDRGETGDLVPVRITDALLYDLEGEVSD